MRDAVTIAQDRELGVESVDGEAPIDDRQRPFQRSLRAKVARDEYRPEHEQQRSDAERKPGAARGPERRLCAHDRLILIASARSRLAARSFDDCGLIDRAR
jgi:hypothetical protein